MCANFRPKSNNDLNITLCFHNQMIIITRVFMVVESIGFICFEIRYNLVMVQAKSSSSYFVVKQQHVKDVFNLKDWCELLRSITFH